MTSNSVHLHRVIRASPAKVYKAFLDADAMARWLPPHGYLGRVHHLDPKVGGGFAMSFTSFATGQGQSFRGDYLELVPGKALRYTSTFDDPGLPGVIQVQVALTEVSCGTSLSIDQRDIPSTIPAEMCYLGWQDSLAQLTHLVEATV